jgi:hypothetical protein
MPMNRFRGGVFATATVVAGAVIGVSACTHDDSTLFVREVLAPTQVAPGTGCMFTNDPAQSQIQTGILDLDLRADYSAAYLVGNQLVAQADPTVPRTETSIVTIDREIVTIKDVNNVQLAQYQDSISTVINPAAGGTPSYGSISVTTIDATTAATSGPPPGDTVDVVRLFTYVKFLGRTLGGESVESNEYEFPVDLCRGCLITVAPADISPLFESPNCVGTGQSAATSAPCAIGQDLPVDCSLCKSISTACNPTPILIGSMADAGTTTATADAATE